MNSKLTKFYVDEVPWRMCYILFKIRLGLLTNQFAF